MIEDAPRLIERKNGLGWLAVSPKGVALRIGVAGSTKREAALRFRDALVSWRRNLAPPICLPMKEDSQP